MSEPLLRSLRHPLLIIAAAGLFAPAAPSSSQAKAEARPGDRPSITVRADRPGIAMSPLMYGLFFEEINHAGEGGLWAEMVRNRSFEDSPSPDGWYEAATGRAKQVLLFDTADPLRPENPTSLRITVLDAGGGRAGVANEGFWGIAVRTGEAYEMSLYARAAADFSGELTAALESEQGEIYAETRIRGLSGSWKRFSASLTSRVTDPAARLVLSTTATGTFWIDLVSLFPRRTWLGRENGLRVDLMQKLKDLRPSFLRFPGGSFSPGYDRASSFRWKTTLGDVAGRPGHPTIWDYRSNDGLGFHEYLQMAEDLGAEPVFAVYAGQSNPRTTRAAFPPRHTPRIAVQDIPPDQMGPVIQDAVDALDYANGPADGRWGRLRAEAGHPEPFRLRYLETANENGLHAYYREKYAAIYRAVKAFDPQARLIFNARPSRPRPREADGVPIETMFEMVYFAGPGAALRFPDQYASYDRRGPLIAFLEYSVDGTNLRSALGESAMAIGLERQADIVRMVSYAPLLCNVNSTNVATDLIYFNSTASFGTPAYHAQKMFSENRPLTVWTTEVVSPMKPAGFRGTVGLALSGTEAEFKEIRVTRGGSTVPLADEAKPDLGWRPIRGRWSVRDGVFRPAESAGNPMAVAPAADLSDYAFTLKARKIGGREGFRILFGVREGGSEYTVWNVGGVKRTSMGETKPEERIAGEGAEGRHSLEDSFDGPLDVSVAGTVEIGRWYDVEVRIEGLRARCFLDGRLIHDVTAADSDGRHRYPASYGGENIPYVAGRAERPYLYATAGSSGRTIILKVVNTSSRDEVMDIRLPGVRKIAPQGTAIVLGSENLEDGNSFDSPEKISGARKTISGLGPDFMYRFPAHSLTILRLETFE